MRIIDFFEALGLPRNPWDKDLGPGDCSTREEIVMEFVKVFARHGRHLRDWISEHEEFIVSDSASKKHPFNSPTPWRQAEWRYRLRECSTGAARVLDDTYECCVLAKKAEDDGDILELHLRAERLSDQWWRLQKRSGGDSCIGEEAPTCFDTLAAICESGVEDLEVINHKVKIRIAVALRATNEAESLRRERDKLKKSFEAIKKQVRR